MLTKRDYTLATLVAVVTLTFFVLTLRPDVGGTEDSPKFQFVGRTLGTAHSPGYPFYVMATYAFGRLPIGTLAYRINLFSAVCGALTCVCIFLTSRRIGVTRLLSAAAALTAATSYPVWSNSVTAEVYTLAAVLSGFAVYWLIAFAQTSAFAREASFGAIPPEPPARGGSYWRLYAACAMWACGFGNHLTIVGILPAAVAYGVVKDRSVLRPRVALTAAVIGMLGVAQYWFIAIRTMQGAPYLEARADTIKGVFDIIIARDVSWARFYQAQSTVAAIEVPMLLNGLRIHMGTIAIALVAFAIVMGIKRRNAEVLLIFGAAAGTLAMIANLWGDVVGFITPVCAQLWPLAALGVQWLVMAAQRANGRAGQQMLTAAGLAAMLVPVVNFSSNRLAIEALRTPGEGPGVRALYEKLPARSAIVAENYWLARLVNYMHFSDEVIPDPNPRVLDNDAGEVRAAVADGLGVYAFEGATHWLNAQGLRFEKTDIARQSFESWIAAQPEGTLIVAASAGRALPLEWLPAASRAQSGRRANYGAFAWAVGSEAIVDQQDSAARVDMIVGAPLTIASADDGPTITWGDDVLVAIDRGLAVAAFTPVGRPIGQWAFALDEKPGVQLPPTPYVLSGESPCAVLRPGQRTAVGDVLADGGWWATVEGKGKATIALATDQPPALWRHRLASGRGEASIDAQGSRLALEAVPGTRSIFRLSMPPSAATPAATLEPSDINAVRVCRAAIPSLPSTGGLEVGADHDDWFGAGWHLGERSGAQRFRWSERSSSLLWRMEKPANVRMILHLRAANAGGAAIQASINGLALASCRLPAGAWTDCTFRLPETSTRVGINELSLNADTMSPSADRPGDARELAFEMQASRVRVGQ